MKFATFAWSWTVEVPDDFTEDINLFKQDEYERFTKARYEAFLNVQERDGDLTDLQDK